MHGLTAGCILSFEPNDSIIGTHNLLLTVFPFLSTRTIVFGFWYKEHQQLPLYQKLCIMETLLPLQPMFQRVSATVVCNLQVACQSFPLTFFSTKWKLEVNDERDERKLGSHWGLCSSQKRKSGMRWAQRERGRKWWRRWSSAEPFSLSPFLSVYSLPSNPRKKLINHFSANCILHIYRSVQVVRITAARHKRYCQSQSVMKISEEEEERRGISRSRKNGNWMMNRIGLKTSWSDFFYKSVSLLLRLYSLSFLQPERLRNNHKITWK